MYTPIIKIEWYVQIIPHSSKKIKYHRSYLVNLATCNIPAAELTSHPHLGGDDNANPLELLKRCAENHTFDSGDPDCKTVLDQLYRAYAESHENDPPGIRDGFKELENYLEVLPLDDNNSVFNLCCRICVAFEHKAFIDGFHYGFQLMKELK